MNEKTLKLLEFDAILSSVASLSLSEEAGKMILLEAPLLVPEEAKKLKDLVKAALKRIVFSTEEKRESFPDISTILSKLDVPGAVLEIDEVYALGIFIKRSGDFKDWLLKPFTVVNEPGNPADDCLGQLAKELPDCSPVSKAIFKIIDYEGNLRDLPEFRSIRKTIQGIQKDIDSTGSRYMKNDDTRRMLQSEIPSQRDGRMVLAVKANFRSRIRGIVHEVSSSGQTVFIEPEEVVEMNNELLIEKRRLDAEIRRVLRELTNQITQEPAAGQGRLQVARRGSPPGREELKILHKGILFLETIRARARYSHERKGVFSGDENDGRLVLKKARHPLLGSKAVPLDLYMEQGIHTVIITGPNTGGKTVALKTLGLLAMMNQAGLALPAEEGTFLPFFDGIYADIGDEQSLSQSLSTFSGHMLNIADIIKRTSEHSLVLLDELGSGTDPEEGSAIAMAILDHFIKEKTRLVVTTHHGILKNYGYTREGVENASMEFESRTLSPTFKIIMGIPGESRALDIALRNGFPEGLLKDARNYLDEERSDVSALITGLKEKHEMLNAAAETGKKEKEKLLEERRQADLKELRLRQKEFLLQSEGAGSLKKLLGESRKTLENLVREVKEGELTREKTLKVKEFLSGLEVSVLAEETELEKERLALVEEKRSIEESGGSEKSIKLVPGMDVFAGQSRRRGRIIRLDKKKQKSDETYWIVEIGSVKLSFQEKEIYPAVPGKDSVSLQKSASWDADLMPSAPLCFELNLLGMRLSDALDSLGRQIDSAVIGGLREFSVVHGKGDGILSQGVHGFLKNDPRVADYYFSRPESGGFGRTEVILK